MTASDDEKTDEAQGEDLQLLRLLDAVDRLLRLRDSLSQQLSHGWMEIAAARYAMGPSRVSQSFFSLKPCHASTTVVVSSAKDAAEDNGTTLTFEFCDSTVGKGLDESCSLFEEETQGPKEAAVRQRHFSGRPKSNLPSVESGFIDEKATKPEKPENCGNGEAKHIHDSSSCFGILLSPHLRTAQSSFMASLEILVELATVQNLAKEIQLQIMKARCQGEVEQV